MFIWNQDITLIINLVFQNVVLFLNVLNFCLLTCSSLAKRDDYLRMTHFKVQFSKIRIPIPLSKKNDSCRLNTIAKTIIKFSGLLKKIIEVYNCYDWNVPKLKTYLLGFAIQSQPVLISHHVTLSINNFLKLPLWKSLQH